MFGAPIVDAARGKGNRMTAKLDVTKSERARLVGVEDRERLHRGDRGGGGLTPDCAGRR